MKPLVHHNRMDDVTKEEQKKLCRCSRQCERFVVISYTRGPVLTMCETESKRYIEEIATAMGFVKPNWMKGRRAWTIEEENRLIEFYKENKGRYGNHKLIAAELGFIPEQIKHKVERLRIAGRIEREGKGRK